MKKILLGFLVGLMGFVFSCASMKSKKQVEGSVESIEFAKDGYTAKVKTTKNEIYLATISRVNLGAEKYKVLKVGEKVIMKGETWKTTTENYIKVEDVVLAK